MSVRLKGNTALGKGQQTVGDGLRNKVTIFSK